MIVQIDTSLSEIPELMKTLAAQLQELEVQYRVMPSSSTAHTVTWRRKKTSRSLNEDMTNVSCVSRRSRDNQDTKKRRILLTCKTELIRQEFLVF